MEIKKISQSILGEFQNLKDSESQTFKKESNAVSKYADAFENNVNSKEKKVIDIKSSRAEATVLAVDLKARAEIVKNASKQQEIKETESKIEKEKEAATVNFVGSAVAAGAAFGMGAGGAAASAGAAASTGEAPEQSKKVESEITKFQSELELFKAKVHKLLA
jgi:hypothetical protein